MANLIELELICYHYIILRIKEILQNLRKEKFDGDWRTMKQVLERKMHFSSRHIKEY